MLCFIKDDNFILSPSSKLTLTPDTVSESRGNWNFSLGRGGLPYLVCGKKKRATTAVITHNHCFMRLTNGT